MKRIVLFAAIGVGVVVAAGIGSGQAPAGGADRLTADLLKGLAWRSIGPTLSTGRMVEVEKAILRAIGVPVG